MMSRDVCLVTSRQRPEFLTYCLRAIHAAEKPRALDVVVSLDVRKGESFNTALGCEACELPLDFGVMYTCAQAHNWPGNSYNVLEAYRWATEQDYRYVFLVEDDVLVSPDFFRYHYAVYETADPFVSVGHRNIRRKDLELGDAGDIHLTGSDYASLGVCWKAENLAPVLKHAFDQYYAYPDDYCWRVFDRSKEFCEQDGLILRVMKEQGRQAAYPYVGRCGHVGFAGYHRKSPWDFTAKLAERIERLGRILSDPALLAAQDTYGGGDISLPPEARPWETLRVRQVFP